MQVGYWENVTDEKGKKRIDFHETKHDDWYCIYIYEDGRQNKNRELREKLLGIELIMPSNFNGRDLNAI